MKVKIKKLSPEATIPNYAKKGDCGMDLVAISIDIQNEFTQYHTGLSVEIPEGYMGLIFPRSSISKYDLSLANSIGLIDSGYRGEILCRFKDAMNYGVEVLRSRNIYKVGDKIAQLVILPYPEIEFEEVEELSVSDRGQGGFGSTGK